MLQTLSIKNYALIEELEIEFTPRLNILTGETGAGKSIIMGALGLVLGERGSATVVRKNVDKCEINAVFEITYNLRLKELLKSFEFDSDDEIILRREINGDGKSKCYVNARPVNLSVLESVGNLLVNIHGQHSHQALFNPIEQCNLLDNYGGLISLRDRVAQVYEQLIKVKKEQELLFASEQERAQKVDLYKFQIQEIDNANLIPGEDEQLEQEFSRLNNAEKLAGLVENVHQLLASENVSSLPLSQKAKPVIEQITRIDSSVAELEKNLSEVVYNLEEIVRQIEDYREKIEFNPKRLEEVADRRELIKQLKKKHGSTIEEILAYGEKIKTEMERLANVEENKQDLEKKITEIESELNNLAEKLSQKRKSVAIELQKKVEKELQELGMAKARFVVSVEPNQTPDGKLIIDARGKDKIEFMIAPNIGEGLKPVAQTASGGELSRIMLAIKTVFAKADNIPTLIFDEIDTGIGGNMGKIVGSKLSSLSQSHQVLCITHLPQIAVYGNKHLQVDKRVASGRTYTVVAELKDKARLEEIARMLGAGKEPSKITLQHAQEMLDQELEHRN